MKKSKVFQFWAKMDEKNGEKIEYDWVKGNLIIQKKHFDILNEQNVAGAADQDRGADEGVELTNMIDKIFEDESYEH